MWIPEPDNRRDEPRFRLIPHRMMPLEVWGETAYDLNKYVCQQDFTYPGGRLLKGLLSLSDCAARSMFHSTRGLGRAGGRRVLPPAARSDSLLLNMASSGGNPIAIAAPFSKRRLDT